MRSLSAILLLVTLLASPGPAFASDLDPFEETQRLALCREGEAALEQGREGLRAEPDRVELLHLLARLQEEAERVPDGLSLLPTLVDEETRPARHALYRGMLEGARDSLQTARELLERARLLFLERGESLGYGLATLESARLLRSLDRGEEARRLLQEIVPLDAGASGPILRLEVALERAELEEEAGDRERARLLLEEVLEVGREARAPRSLARLLDRLARVHEKSGNLDRAATLYGEAAERSEALHCVASAIDFDNRAAADMFELGQTQEAQELLRSNLRRARAAGDMALQADALYNLARAQRRLQDIEAALETCEMLDELEFTDERGLRNRNRIRLIRTQVLQQMGRLREALATVEELDPDAQRLGGMWPVLAWNARANVLLDLGEIDTAIELYGKAHAFAEEHGDRRRMAIYGANLAGCHFRLGRYQEALQGYTRSQQLFEELNLGFDGAMGHLNLANVQLRVGNLEAATAEAERALRRFEELGAGVRIASCLNTLAVLQIERDSLDEAREFARQGLAQARALGSLDEEMRSLFLLGRIDVDAGRLDDSAVSLRAVLERVEEGEGLLFRSRALSVLGDLELRRGRVVEARDLFGRAIEAAHALDSPRFDVTPHVGMARSHRRLGEREEALRHYRLAIENIEKLRWGTGPDEERWFVLGGNSAPYAEAASLLLEEATPADAIEEAFRLVEMGRARTLIDRLDQLGIDADEGIPAGLRRERKENLERTSYLRAHLLNRGEGEDDALARSRAELAALEEEYDRIEGRIRQLQNPLVGLRDFEPVPLAEIRSLLPPDALLLEYLLREDGAWGLAIAADGEARAFALPEDVEAQLAEFRGSLESGRRPQASDLHRYAELGHSLFRSLVAPALEGRTEPVRSLIVAPDGPLWTVPLEALLTGPVGEVDAGDLSTLPYLFRSCELRYVPSSTAWRRMRARRPRGPETDRPALVLADPVYEGQELATGDFTPLPHTAEEAQRVVAALGDARLWTGSEATEDRVKSASLGEYGLLHFATHSTIDEEHPQRSAVVLSLDEDLSEDGFLTIREIYHLELDADLVVLSSCSSAGGEPIVGEGMIALARPFLAVGAAASVVTLWPIDDRSTAEFMGAFYEALATGLSAAASLQRARTAMLRSERPAWRLPYHWAGFLLVGGSE